MKTEEEGRRGRAGNRIPRRPRRPRQEEASTGGPDGKTVDASSRDPQGQAEQATAQDGIPERGPLLTLPYAERQLIMVANDAVVEADHSALRDVKDESWNDVATKTITWLGHAAALAFNGGLYVEAIRFVKALNAARDEGVTVRTVGWQECAPLTFLPGHPRDGVLYAGHPAVPELYYPVAQFHRQVFEHKVSEAVHILMNLGAVTIEVEHVAGWGQEITIDGRGPAGPGMFSAHVAGQKTRHRRQRCLFTAELSGATAPALPADLVWYPHESTWQQIAKGRLHFGLRTCALTIAYDDDYGISATLANKVAKAGLQLGGAFEEHWTATWSINGTFSTS